MAALAGCSVQNDVPEFVYPATSVDPNGAFPTLLPVDLLQSQGTERIAADTQTLDDLTARVATLRRRAAPQPIGGISANRIARLRARAAALQSASF
jgi:hypothetical protein